jgi:hypothetical protein
MKVDLPQLRTCSDSVLPCSSLLIHLKSNKRDCGYRRKHWPSAVSDSSHDGRQKQFVRWWRIKHEPARP